MSLSLKKTFAYLSLIVLVSCTNNTEIKNTPEGDSFDPNFNIHIDQNIAETKTNLIQSGFKFNGNIFEKSEDNIQISILLEGNDKINAFFVDFKGSSEDIKLFTKRFLNVLKRKYPDLQESNGYYATRYLEGDEEIILELIISENKLELSHRKNH